MVVIHSITTWGTPSGCPTPSSIEEPPSQPSHSGCKPPHCSSPPSGLLGHLFPPQQTEYSLFRLSMFWICPDQYWLSRSRTRITKKKHLLMCWYKECLWRDRLIPKPCFRKVTWFECCCSNQRQVCWTNWPQKLQLSLSFCPTNWLQKPEASLLNKRFMLSSCFRCDQIYCSQCHEFSHTLLCSLSQT